MLPLSDILERIGSIQGYGRVVDVTDIIQQETMDTFTVILEPVDHLDA